MRNFPNGAILYFAIKILGILYEITIMKMLNRERVDGTDITIGQRVYGNLGKDRISKKYSAEFRDLDGKQRCQSLGTTNRSQARRKAIEIQQQIERGLENEKPSNITIDELTKNYLEIVKAKGVAPKTVAKYRTNLDKLKDYCYQKKIRFARQFSENDLYLYRQYLVDKIYADKTIEGAIVLAKQIFKWSWRQGILQNYRLEAATFPKAKAKPQPCFTSKQVHMLIDQAIGTEKTAFALMAYAGLRIGEVEQLCWQDVIVKDNLYAMIHVRRGGSNGTTKDKDDRFVPVHPIISDLLGRPKKRTGRIFNTITERRLLKRIKQLCKICEFDNPNQYKLHTFRHHFASMCANHGVAHRKVLAWLGHSSSEMLDLYYHLHDEDSQRTMQALAASDKKMNSSNGEKYFVEGNLRATGRSKTEKTLQVLEVQELISSLSNITEKAGFEPAVRNPVHSHSKSAP